MTAPISLILGKTGAHRAPLQLRLFNFFPASMTADDVALTDRRRSAKRKRDSAQAEKIDRGYGQNANENRILIGGGIKNLIHSQVFIRNSLARTTWLWRFRSSRKTLHFGGFKG